MDNDQILKIAEVRHLAESGMARRIRVAAGISIPECSAAVGVNVSTISRWERGLRRPGTAAAIRWGELLDRMLSR